MIVWSETKATKKRQLFLIWQAYNDTKRAMIQYGVTLLHVTESK